MSIFSEIIHVLSSKHTGVPIWLASIDNRAYGNVVGSSIGVSKTLHSGVGGPCVKVVTRQAYAYTGTQY